MAVPSASGRLVNTPWFGLMLVTIAFSTAPTGGLLLLAAGLRSPYSAGSRWRSCSLGRGGPYSSPRRDIAIKAHTSDSCAVIQTCSELWCQRGARRA